MQLAACGLLPVTPVKTAVLNGFGHVVRRDVGCAFKVGNGPADLQDAVIRPRRKPQACHSRLQHLPAGTVKPTVAPDSLRRHVRIAKHGWLCLVACSEAFELAFARPHHPRPDGGGVFTGRIGGQFPEMNGRNVHVNVNPVQQRAGDFGDIPLNLGRRALAFAGGVVENHMGRDSSPPPA